MLYSWFPTERPTPAQRQTFEVRNFPELVQVIGAPRAFPSKKGIPMFSPAIWPPGAPKTLANVLSVQFGVLDYDDVPFDDLAEMLARMDVPYVFVSSWSHGDREKAREAMAKLKAARLPKGRPSMEDLFKASWAKHERPSEAASADDADWAEAQALVRGRLLVPFSRPVTPEEYPRVWRHLYEQYRWGRCVSDDSCRDASHCYFVPAHPQNPPKPPIYIDQSRGQHLWRVYSTA